MRFDVKQPPRGFSVGRRTVINLKDCGSMQLEPDEQITFVTPDGAEYDVARKAWGFYATPSLNGRLLQFGLRTVLVRNPEGKCYVMLVQKGHEAAFQAYLESEAYVTLAWLDNEESLRAIERAVANG